jgi:hypothetical protein
MDFVYFKSITGIILVIVFMLAFMNTISLENTKLSLETSLENAKLLLKKQKLG